jgi:L-asparaginase
MGNKKRILVIFTGGTIASSIQKKVASPNKKSFQSLYSYVKQFFYRKNVELICYEPWGIPGKDSSNLDPVNWIKITSIIAKELENQLDGVLILYGTDTMAYLSAWLKLCFPNIQIPIILTGSQLTLDFTPEDVTVNLPGAAQVVYDNVPGVWIYCNWKLFPGNRVHKAHAIHPDVFIATNGLPIYFNMDWTAKYKLKNIRVTTYVPPEWLNKILNYPAEKVTEIIKKISWLMCAPGIEPEVDSDKKIICIYGFGAGNAPVNVLNYLQNKFKNEEEKPSIIACSQAEGDIKKPDYYKEVGIAWLSHKGFNVWSQMDYPIEYIHSLACYSLLINYNNPGKVLSKHIQGPFGCI